MSAKRFIALLAAATLLGAAPPRDRRAESFPMRDLPASCGARDGWTDPAPPAHIYGNTWYVGTCGIAALLITTPKGHVLIDGGMPAAAPLVAGNILRLGFHPGDVRWILSSHEHFDHAGALAELKRLTGAKLAALPISAAVLVSGKPDPADPQLGSLEKYPLPPVEVDRVLRHGERIELGGTVLTAWSTPAHSPGSTSWTWRACESGQCQTITYADSASTISDDTYRFADHPRRVTEARRGLEAIGALPCGVLITPHPSASNLFARFASGAIADKGACRTYAESAAARFDARLAKERGQ